MPGLTLDIARRCLDRAMASAKQEFKRPICVAVCDPQGFLLAFARMEGAPVRSIQISQGKAYTAARMGVSTAGCPGAIEEGGHRDRLFLRSTADRAPRGKRAQG